MKNKTLPALIAKDGNRPMKNVIFLYNPKSGEAGVGAHLDEIVNLYQKSGFIVTPLRISREIGFDPIISMVSKFDPAHILIAGGDGTVNRFVNFMMENDLNIPIAILPSGTANDFAKMIGMPTSVPRAVRKILSGKIEKFDLGRAADKYFINIFSTGLFTDISQKTPTKLKNTFGKVAYYFGSISELPNFRHLNVNIASPEASYKGKCLLLLIFNGQTAGNIPLAQRSSAQDGMLDVMIIKGKNIVQTIQALFHFLSQRKGEYPNDVVYFQTSSVKVEIDNDPASDIDGEPAGGFPMEVSCVPGAIQVIIPGK